MAGGYRDAQNFQHAFVADEVNGTWQASQDVPGLAGILMSYTDVVSCTAPGDCAATGSYDVNSQYSGVLDRRGQRHLGHRHRDPWRAAGGPGYRLPVMHRAGLLHRAGDLDGLDLVSEATGTVTTITAAANDGSADEQGAPVTVSVTSPAGGTPTGTVTVTSPLQPTGHACTVTLSGGTGTCVFPTTGLSAGSYQLTATYNGDTTYAASASAATTELTVTSIGLGLTGSSTGIAGQPMTLDG